MQGKGIQKIATFFLISGMSCAVLICRAQAEGLSRDQADKIEKKLDALEKEVEFLRVQLKESRKNEASDRDSNTCENKPEAASIKKASGHSVPASTKDSLSIHSVKNLNQDLDPGLFGIAYRSSDSLQFGAYGEVKFGRQQTAEGWKNGFDASRVVLLGTYPIAEDILFNSEIEFEHGGIAQDADDKLGGAVEIEQVFVDFKVNDYFNWRAPGVDIVPVGYVGLFHEPTQFYSVDRPELYDGLIPATWFEGSTSGYGKVVDNLTYQVQISTGLEDAGSMGSDSDGSVASGGYDPGISGTEALGLARASISDRKQLGNNLGYAARLAYTPPVVPGLAGSTSFYYTPNTSARGAYGTRADGSTVSLGKSNLGLVDTELRYRIPATGVELRAEYVDAFFEHPVNLRANNDGDPENNVGKNMYGYSFEGAYHADLSNFGAKGWEFVPFYRYTKENLQTGGFAGLDDNAPTGAGDRQFHTFGFSLFPTSKLVLKLDYQLASDDATDSPRSDHLLGSVGYFF